MVMVGSTSHALARVVFAVAEVSWLFYVGMFHVNFQITTVMWLVIVWYILKIFYACILLRGPSQH
jgi:hypothetical protein